MRSGNDRNVVERDDLNLLLQLTFPGCESVSPCSLTA